MKTKALKIRASKLLNRRWLITTCCFAFAACMAFADSKGGAGFSAATTEISSYKQPVQNLMNAIAAVIAIVGAFNVYFKMQNGDQDVKKTIMMTIGGCVAFVALAQALPLFFD